MLTFASPCGTEAVGAPASSRIKARGDAFHPLPQANDSVELLRGISTGQQMISKPLKIKVDPIWSMIRAGQTRQGPVIKGPRSIGRFMSKAGVFLVHSFCSFYLVFTTITVDYRVFGSKAANRPSYFHSFKRVIYSIDFCLIAVCRLFSAAAPHFSPI